MIHFDNIWRVLYDHGACENKRIECSELWATYTPEQQEQILTTITNKLKKDKFVHYDPIRAIRENAPRAPQTEPTDWNGRALVPTEHYATAFYNGKWGMYTLKDIELFHLKVKN